MSELSKLFRWKRKIAIVDNTGNVVKDENGKEIYVYMRVVGDSDYQEARNVALKRSRMLRKVLRDEKSDEHVSNFIDLDSMDKDELLLGIVFSEISDYRDEGMISIGEAKVPELPDNPSLEDQEEYQASVEKSKEDRVKRLTEFIEDKIEERKKILGEKSKTELRKMYVTSTINMRCAEEFTSTFREHCIYKGTFKNEDYSELAFDSFDDFETSSYQLKNQLTSAYNDLELSGEQLKN